MSKPFDAVLVVAFGGPQGPADVRPFLANVLRGRRISPERLEEVVGHYEHFGGVSPLTDITMRQARGLQSRLSARGFDLPVYVGMRNWNPFLADTLRTMAADGVAARLVSCSRRTARIRAARSTGRMSSTRGQKLSQAGLHDVRSFIPATGTRTRNSSRPTPTRRAAQFNSCQMNIAPAAQVVFTAHSVPSSMSGAGALSRADC